jgi:hypothetical protein
MNLEVCDVPTNIDVPNSVTHLNQIPIFEWCVVRCGSKNGYQKGISVYQRLESVLRI